MIIANLETITGALSWYKILPRRGSNLVRAKTKTSQETQRSLQKFLEPNRKPKVIYTDNSLEFGEACEDLSWNHCTSTPHRSETNGIAERAVGRVKEGTSAVRLVFFSLPGVFFYSLPVFFLSLRCFIPRSIQSDNVRRKRGAVPEAGRTKTMHTSDDRQNQGTIPMPTLATRPSTMSSTIPVELPQNYMVGQQRQ